MMHSILSGAFALTLLWGATAFADDPVNATCPISGEAVDASVVTTFEGTTIGFCCASCQKPFEAWTPERKREYLAGLSEPAKGAEPAEKADEEKEAAKSDSAPVGDPYTLGTCPVSGKQLGSMGDPPVRVYRGREVRFCCGGCIGRFEKDLDASLAKLDEKIIADQERFYPEGLGCIVTGEALEEGKAVDVVVGNRLFRLCCKGCAKDLRKEPAKYIRELDEAVAAAQRPAYPLETCVVKGGKLGSMGEPTEMVIAGRLIRFCCGGCEPKVRANPRRFIEQVDAAWAEKGKFVGPASRPAGDAAKDDGADD